MSGATGNPQETTAKAADSCPPTTALAGTFPRYYVHGSLAGVTQACVAMQQSMPSVVLAAYDGIAPKSCIGLFSTSAHIICRVCVEDIVAIILLLLLWASRLFQVPTKQKK